MAAPLKVAEVDERYPVPVMLMVCEGEPARTARGVREVTVGAGLSAGVTGGVGWVGVVEVEFEPPPLQPERKERPRTEQTTNAAVRRTNPPEKIMVVPENGQRRLIQTHRCLILLC